MEKTNIVKFAPFLSFFFALVFSLKGKKHIYDKEQYRKTEKNELYENHELQC